MIEGDRILKVELVLSNGYTKYWYIWQGFIILEDQWAGWDKAESIKEWRQIYQNKQQGTMTLYEGVYNGISD